MCQLKSGIILKDRVFVPEYDSHSKMLKELKIKDTRENAERLFVRAELLPPDGDVFEPVENWEYHVDQDILPDWYVADYEEQRMREAVKEWAKTHIHIGVTGLEISSGSGHYIKDCKDVNIYDNATVNNIYGSATVNNIYGSATVEYIRDSATVKYICDSATVKYICDSATVNNIYDNATVNNIYGSATVKNIYGSATVKNICDSATVKNIYDNATVEKAMGNSVLISSPHGWNKKSSLILTENSTLKDRETKTIWQAGEWKLCEYQGEIK